MAPTAERSSLIHRVLPLITLSLFTMALWVLHDALRESPLPPYNRSTQGNPFLTNILCFRSDGIELSGDDDL